MKASSIGLAAILLFGAIDCANAGFAGASFRTGFAPHPAFSHAPAPVPMNRFGSFGPNPFWRNLGGFWPIYNPPVGYAPLPVNTAPAGYSGAPPIVNAPSYGATIFIAPTEYAYAPPPVAAAGGGPKIIRIGAPPRSAFLKKAPVVIYGSSRVGGTY
jgi:hypothetical protein